MRRIRKTKARRHRIEHCSLDQDLIGRMAKMNIIGVNAGMVQYLGANYEVLRRAQSVSGGAAQYDGRRGHVFNSQ